MISSPAETPSACGYLERVVGNFLELGVVNRNSSG
jgi:hypothetical protein